MSDENTTQDLINKLHYIGSAISARSSPGIDAAGTHVDSLTEAVMGITAGLFEVASAIREVAYALEGGEDDDLA